MSNLSIEAKETAINALFNILPLNFCWTDAQGVILGCNQRMIESINRNFDLIGKHTKDVASQTAWKNTQKVLQTGKSLTCEEIHMKDDGENAYYLSMKSPIKSSKGEVIGCVNVAIDITDKKRMEKELIKANDMALIAEKTKSEFLSNMRHDFRTPFTGIVSISQFLEENETDATKKSFLKDIQTSSESLLNHINSILEYVRLGKQTTVVHEEFNLHTILNNLYKISLPLAESKNIDFKLIMEKNLPKKLIGDELKTQQVLCSLLSNAFKFTEKGHVNLYAGWDNERNVMQFIIEDTGIGIKENEQEIIFEPFHRLTSSYSGVYEGKGLGLTVVKEILDDIDGQYKITSALGEGTIFKVVIPYKLSLLDQVNLQFSEENVITMTHERKNLEYFKINQ